MSTIGRALKHAIQQTGISQDEVARRVGVSQPTVSRWAAGETEPTSDQLNKIAAAIGRPIVVVFGGQQKRAAPSAWTERLVDGVDRIAAALEALRQPAGLVELKMTDEQLRDVAQRLARLQKGKRRNPSRKSTPDGAGQGIQTGHGSRRSPRPPGTDE